MDRVTAKVKHLPQVIVLYRNTAASSTLTEAGFDPPPGSTLCARSMFIFFPA